MLLHDRVDGRVYRPYLEMICIALGIDTGGGGGGGGSGSFFTIAPATANGVNNNNDDAVYDRGWRRRCVMISGLICAKSVGMWRASSSDQEYSMNDGDND